MIWLALLAWFLVPGFAAFLSQRWLWSFKTGNGWFGGLMRWILGTACVVFAAVLIATMFAAVFDGAFVGVPDPVVWLASVVPLVASVAAWAVFAPTRLLYLPLIIGVVLSVLMTSAICGVSFPLHLNEDGHCSATDQPVEVFLSFLSIFLAVTAIGVAAGCAIKFGFAKSGRAMEARQ